MKTRKPLGFAVLTAVVMKTSVFCDTPPCSPLIINGPSEKHVVKYNYNDQVKDDEMGRASSTNGEMRNAYRILV
jgi:hypothetical protein